MVRISHQPEYTGAMSAFVYSDALDAAYTFKGRFGDIVKLGVRRGGTLYVPRETCPVGKTDARIDYPPLIVSHKALVPRNVEQLPLAERSASLLDAGQNHIIEAPTGWGKTVVGAYVAVQYGRPTLIVVTKTDLIRSWQKAFIDVLGVDPILVGVIQQDRCEFEDKRFVIGMVHSLIIPDRYPPEMYRHFGLVEFDEVHQMAADCFILACQKFPAKARLGLSATVRRADGKMPAVHAHIGPTLVRGTIVPMKPKVLVKPTGWSLPMFKNADGTLKKMPITPGQMTPVYKKMMASNQRNRLILDFVQSAFRHDRRVLVIADLIEHLDRLFMMFTSGGISGENIGYYIGGKSNQELEAAKDKAVILATYRMCSTGTDVPQWDSLVMANPRADITQTLGRVIRYVEGKNTPVVLDLVDGDRIFNSFYFSRLRQYAAVGADVVQMQ